ncbi:hypothetical protein OV203_20180 [Nannocystis sp. ILAH1]|uniref:hypothetical protein n=1 Tax=Nannocystis sp. ILAH1 TaxID=2996789 RepID=UPI00226EFA66|nr:hypothetical protein [Nannocystis sp. ILAH1]MCY0989469.1 hypothetical protein [Nannocystis sp. ILAH1]
MRNFRSRLSRASIALATALSLGSSSVQAAEPAAISPEEARRFEEARQRYADDQYLPAAELFEALHHDTGNPLYLYYAGLAREGAGHDAHAALHWRRALRAGLDETFAAKAQGRLDQLKSRTTEFTFTVTPAPLTDGAGLELRYRGPGERRPLVVTKGDLPLHLEPGDWSATLTSKHPGFESLAVPLSVARGAPQLAHAFEMRPIEHPATFELGPEEAVRAGIVLTLRDPDNLAPERRETLSNARFTAPLRAGLWNYTLEAPGHRSQSGTLTVGPGAPPLTIMLAPANSTPPTTSDALLAPPMRRRLALGYGTASIVPAVAGVTLTALAAKTDVPAALNGNLAENSLKPVNDRFLGGGLLLGTTIGLWTGTVLTALPLRRRAWYVAVGAGGALAVGGLAWNLGTYAAFRDEHFTDGGQGSPCDLCGSLSPDEWKRDRSHLLASTLVLGVGAGLLLTAATNLIIARRRPSLALRPAPTGFSIRF